MCDHPQSIFFMSQSQKVWLGYIFKSPGILTLEIRRHRLIKKWPSVDSDCANVPIEPKLQFKGKSNWVTFSERFRKKSPLLVLLSRLHCRQLDTNTPVTHTNRTATRWTQMSTNTLAESPIDVSSSVVRSRMRQWYHYCQHLNQGCN